MDLRDLFDKIMTDLVDIIAGQPEVIYYVDVLHDSYEGYDCIYFDDTEIKFLSNNKFMVTDYQETFLPFEASGKEVIEFYKGMYAAFAVISPADPEYFKKGFQSVVDSFNESCRKEAFPPMSLN